MRNTAETVVGITDSGSPLEDVTSGCGSSRSGQRKKNVDRGRLHLNDLAKEAVGLGYSKTNGLLLELLLIDQRNSAESASTGPLWQL